MPLLALGIVVAIAACGTCLILAGARRLRTPRELRGDWWPEFEREFRAYAARRDRAGTRERERERRRHRGQEA